MNEVTYKITKEVAVLRESEKGYTKEVNFVSWNGNEEKLDVREWFPDRKHCGKGITLTKDEGKKLFEALSKIYSADES